LFKKINEELAGTDVLLHLRFTTAGKTNLRNAHPFSILEMGHDGVDLRMAHNGTIQTFKTKAAIDESDTRAFARMFVRPLFKRLIKGMDIETILADPFVEELLSSKMPATSVLTFLDGMGNSMYVNETGNGGKEEEGWYYSNVYSFDADHRKPKSAVVYGGWKGSGSNSYFGQAQGSGYYSGYSDTGYNEDYGTSYFDQKNREIELTKDSNVERYTKKHDLKIGELLSMSDDTIEELVLMEGDEAVSLIKELLALTKGLLEAQTNLTSQIKVLKKKVGGK
jgi:hypothetical protein